MVTFPLIFCNEDFMNLRYPYACSRCSLRFLPQMSHDGLRASEASSSHYSVEQLWPLAGLKFLHL